MKQTEIKVGTTYLGKRGKTRTVTEIRRSGYSSGNYAYVYFIRHELWNNQTTGSMSLLNFAGWAKKIVLEEEG